MKKAVIFVVYGRHEYTEKTLQSWSETRNVSDFDFFFKLEPHSENNKIVESINNFSIKTGCSVKILFNETVLGVDGQNHESAMRYMFEDEGYDFVVLAENDLIVSKDAINYFELLSNQYYNDESVFAICANYHTPANYKNMWNEENLIFPNENDINVCDLKPFWAGWVWGTWKDRWNKYLFNGMHRDGLHYDAMISQEVVPNNNLLCVVPRYSRSQNIGEHGAHYSDPNDFRMSQVVFREDYEWDFLVSNRGIDMVGA